MLPMRDMAHMFNAPPIDPLSPSPSEVLGVSGARYVLQQFETRRQVKAETLHLVLPHGQISLGLAEQTRLALQRYAEFRIQEQQALVRETRHRGWRVTVAALILSAFFVTLANFFASEATEGMRPVFRRTLEHGFEIIGWIMLWRPIDSLVFEPIAINHKIAALRRLMQLQVVAETADSTFQSPTKRIEPAVGTEKFKPQIPPR